MMLVAEEGFSSYLNNDFEKYGIDIDKSRLIMAK